MLTLFWAGVGAVWGVIYVLSPSAAKIALIPIAFAFIAQVAFIMRQFRRFNVENYRAMEALNRGDLAEARNTFEAWTRRIAPATIEAVAQHNLAWTMLRQGELKNARDLWAANDDTHRRRLDKQLLGATSAIDLALSHALLGELDAAEKWIAEADRRASKGKPPLYDGMRAYARSVVDCRAGRLTDALAALDARWTEYESGLSGGLMRPLRVVRAFAQAVSPRDAGTVEAMLASLRPVYSGEYDFLTAGWPEMATFLTTYGLRTHS